MSHQLTAIQSMNSLQIAELVEARHDSVKRTIERLVDQEVIAQPPLVDMQKTKGNSRQYTTQTYVFSGEQGKLDSITVVAQLCPHFTAQIVKRWQELESKQSTDPLNQIASNMATLADGITTTLQKLEHTEKYISLLELNQKGHIKITPEVAALVKDYKAQGYTQASIARQLRISNTSVSLIIHDKYPFAELPSDDKVTRMLDTAKHITEQVQLQTHANSSGVQHEPQ